MIFFVFLLGRERKGLGAKHREPQGRLRHFFILIPRKEGKGFGGLTAAAVKRGGAMDISEKEAKLYDRQIRLWGMEVRACVRACVRIECVRACACVLGRKLNSESFSNGKEVANCQEDYSIEFSRKKNDFHVCM